MKRNVWECGQCGQHWIYKPVREEDDPLNDGQCDCGCYIDTHNATIKEVE